MIKKLAILVFGIFFLNITNAQQKVTVDANAKGQKFEHFWSKCVGAGRANEGLRAGWLEQLKQIQQNCGFQYVRFHGLFHDDMFPVFEKNEKITCNWQYIDELFDRMLDLKTKPFVELGFFPKVIASQNSKTQFWWKASITPDENSFGKWQNLVKAFAQHCVDRYGIDEVLTWYFEVWNEPDLNPGFWDSGRSDYFRLYKISVEAVKSVDKRLKVGGPSTSNFTADNRFDADIQTAPSKSMWTKENVNNIEWQGVWIKDFLAYCEKEKLPVDFISCHPYPTDYALNPETSRYEGLTRYVQSTFDDMNWMKKVLAKSAFPNAEIHYTEWSTSPNSRDPQHDFLPPAAYIVKVNLDCIGLANSLSYWTFTDIFEEKGGAESIFHGGFGMINYQGIVKPTYHAYRMLNELGDEKLFACESVFVSRNSGSGKIVILAYNYPEEYKNAVPSGSSKRENGSSKKIDLNVSNLKPGTQFKLEILDKDNGNVHNYWQSIGSPEPPTREQTALLKKVANDLKTEIITVGKDGILHVDRELTPWSLVLIK
ncbi:MAG: glycoside hydrolase [Bacteroidia bacterium]|nr:glycoside hydrolase [Bacteroidia bacterium]